MSLERLFQLARETPNTSKLVNLLQNYENHIDGIIDASKVIVDENTKLKSDLAEARRELIKVYQELNELKPKFNKP